MLFEVVRRAAKSLGYDLVERMPELKPHLRSGLLRRTGFDTILAAYLAGRNDFFFVQIGAHDGRMSDPLWELVHRYRLRGVLVEPQEDLFRALEANYAGQEQVRLVRAAIASLDGTVTLYKADPRFWREHRLPENVDTMIASLDRNQIVKHVAQFGGRRLAAREDEYVAEEEVPALTISTLLARHGVDRLDFLQIDTEGFDFEIIKRIDFERVVPRLLHFEHVHLSEQDRLACWTLLRKRGYGLFATDGINTLAVEETFGRD